MVKDYGFAKASEVVQKDIQTLKQDLRNRPDYGDRQAAEIKALDGLALRLVGLLGKLAADRDVTSGELGVLCRQIEAETLPLLADMVHANTRMAKMGPLNPRQTISPKRAKAINATATNLHDHIQSLSAQLVLAQGRVRADVMSLADPVAERGPELSDENAADTHVPKKALPPDPPPSAALPPPTVVAPPSLKELAEDFRNLLTRMGVDWPQK